VSSRSGPRRAALTPNGLRVLKDAREVGRPWLTPQACLDKHRCGHGRMAMQGLQSLHRAEAMTRSLARPNSRLQCQQINISSFRSHSWGLGGGSHTPTGYYRVAAPGYLRGARQPGCLTPRSRSRIPPTEIPNEDHASKAHVRGDNPGARLAASWRHQVPASMRKTRPSSTWPAPRRCRRLRWSTASCRTLSRVQRALVAQRIEHLTTDQKVGGSSPSERARSQAPCLAQGGDSYRLGSHAGSHAAVSPFRTGARSWIRRPPACPLPPGARRHPS
jgi:hypothetical protein